MGIACPDGGGGDMNAGSADLGIYPVGEGSSLEIGASVGKVVGKSWKSVALGCCPWVLHGLGWYFCFPWPWWPRGTARAVDTSPRTTADTKEVRMLKMVLLGGRRIDNVTQGEEVALGEEVAQLPLWLMSGGSSRK